MSPILYALATALFQILAPVGVGTNLALYQLCFALLSGRFISSRGALVPALAATGLSDDAVRRSVAALAYGKWNLTALVSAWQQQVRREGRFVPQRHGGFSPCHLTSVSVGGTGLFAFGTHEEKKGTHYGSADRQ